MLRSLTHNLRYLLLIVLLSGVTVVTATFAIPVRAAEQQVQLSASEAAAKARALYGGKVLKVSKHGNGYKVKLLQDSGRVITVTIKG
jgi:hypothetical protein